MTTKYHKSIKGKNAGKWVICRAKNGCPLETKVMSSNPNTKVAPRIDNLRYLTDEQKSFYFKELKKAYALAKDYKHDYSEDDPKSREGEQEFLDSYDPTKYTNATISYTADNIIFTEGSNGKLKVLLIERGGHPYKNHWAHPGGFIDGDEKPVEAAVRELKEETNITMSENFLQFVKAYDADGRDPRMDIVMNTHVALIPKLPKYKGSDDALSARLVDVESIYKPNSKILMAFDHKQSIRDAIEFLLK